MRILVTNDDGIGSEGIENLRRIAEEISSDVWVVAPEKNQSGASHSMTLHEPLRVRQTNAPHLRAARHAHRLRDHGSAPLPHRSSARSRSVGHQPRLQPR